MSISADSERTAPGFKALRSRYIRRAEFLVTDEGFRDLVIKARESWNERYPNFAIVTGARDSEPQTGIPSMLQKVMDKATDLSLPAGVPEYQAAYVAVEEWMVSVQLTTLTYFPPDDFPNPYQPILHPARPFIAACLHTSDPGGHRPLRLDASRLFRPYVLHPEPMVDTPWSTPYGRLASPDADDVTWYVPLYPGITAEDIRRSARAIAREAEKLFEGRTSGDRIRALRNQGLTQQVVADRLGLSRSMVAAEGARAKRHDRS